MFGVTEDDDVVTLVGVVLDFASNDTNVRTGGVIEGESEGFEILSAFGGDAVGSDDNYGIVILFFFYLDVGLALVVADFADTFGFHAFHHLAVVNEWAVGVDSAVLVAFGREVTGDVDGSFDSPAEACTLCSDDFHGCFGMWCYAPSGLEKFGVLCTQGCTLGYRVTPRWGLERWLSKSWG